MLIWLILYSALVSVLIETCLNMVFFCLLAFQQVTEGFWKSVAQFVPREPSEIRILNPYFIQEAAFQFIGLPLNNGLMGKGVSVSLIVFLSRTKKKMYLKMYHNKDY